MAVSTTNAISGPYVTNGVTVTFPFTFTAPSADEVDVVLVDSDGEQLSTSGYTVSLGQESGGAVTFSIPPAIGYRLYVLLDPTFEQNIAFENGSAWRAEPVNEGYDRSAARDQVLRRDLNRALLAPFGEQLGALPAASARAGGYLGFNGADGELTVYPGSPIVGNGYIDYPFSLADDDTLIAIPSEIGARPFVVLLNGVELTADDDYTQVGATIVLALAASNGDDAVLRVAQSALALQSKARSTSFNPGGSGAAIGNVEDVLRETVNPLSYQALGDGLTDDRAALLNAAAIGPLTITRNHRIAADTTFSVPVKFVGNGRITVDAGKTATFTGGISADAKRIFYGAGAVAGIKDFQAEWSTEADDTADDTAGLRRAIGCIGANGTLRMGPRVWKITDNLPIAGDHFSIRGSGRRATKIKQYTPGKEVFAVTGDYFSLASLSTEHVTQGTSGGAAIDFDGTYYGTIDDFYAYKPYAGVQYRNGSNSHTGQRIFIEDASQNAVLVSSSVNVAWGEFQLLNSNTATLCALGCIRLVGGVEGCNFVSGHTYQGVYALTTDANAFVFGQVPAYNKFHAVYFDGCTTSTINKSVELDFVDCWFSGRPGNGISIIEADGVRFNGGGAINCGQSGVLVQAGAKRVSIKNFAARSNSVSTPNTHSGITVAAGATDFQITGCTLTNGFLNFGTQKFGVEVQPGASDRYVITGNLIGGNGTAGVSDNGTGTNKTVSGNY